MLCAAILIRQLKSGRKINIFTRTLRKRQQKHIYTIIWILLWTASIGGAMSSCARVYTTSAARTDRPDSTVVSPPAVTTDITTKAIPDSTVIAPSSADSTALPADSISATLPTDTTAMRSDSTLNPISDTISLDSLATLEDEDEEEGLGAPITGNCQDSLVYDVDTEDIYVYTKGTMDYEKMNMKAEFMKFNTGTKNILAYGATDTTTKEYMRPEFKQDQDIYEMDSIRYNIDSRKALIYGVKTKEGEGTISGGVIKKMPDDVVHMKNGKYTTCDADCPHFYLQMTKGSVVPDQKVVFGPAYMVFEDVPFYILGLPFGFFPQQSERNSGFIIPEIGEEVVKGFFLRNGGYYFVFNDYLDLKLTGGIYTLGSWEANVASNYRKRYKFNGNLGFDFAKDVIGESGSADYTNQQNIRLRWSHQQDPKFRPNSTFSASVNYSTSQYNKYNATNMNDYVSSQTSSTIAYSKNWAGKPFSLAINASHSQSLRDSSMSLTLPSFVFNVTRINPFKRRMAVGKERWYEKIAFTYNTTFTNSSNFKSDEFMTSKMLDKMKFGFQHQLPISASFNVLKYLNVTPGVNYTERWYFRKIYKEWDPETEQVINGDTSRGFYRVYNYNVALSANTRIFGTYALGRKTPEGRKGPVIRHVLTPNISFSFAPNFGNESYGYYENVQSSKDGKTTQYSPFAEEPYGVPGSGQSMALNFGLNNTLEMKVKSDKDTTGFRKIKILEAFSITSSYNFLADSLNLAPFSVNLRTTLFKNVSLNISSSFDPYAVDKQGRRINEFAITRGMGLARMTALSFGFSYGFASKAKKESSNTPASNNPKNNTRTGIEAALNDPTKNGFFNQTQNEQANAVAQAQMLASQYYDFNIPWNLSLNYNYSWSRSGHKINLTQTLGFSGGINLTDKWAVELGAGYDIMQRKLTPGNVVIRRDLHCWQASFSWVPVGFRQSWSFSIKAKSSMLSEFMKFDKESSFLDNYYRGN